MLSEVQYQGAEVGCHFAVADEGAEHAASRFGLVDELVDDWPAEGTDNVASEGGAGESERAFFNTSHLTPHTSHLARHATHHH